jgi:hypothetical protein
MKKNQNSRKNTRKMMLKKVEVLKKMSLANTRTPKMKITIFLVTNSKSL